MIGTEQNKTASDALKSVSCVKSCSGQGVCNDGKCKKKNARRVPQGSHTFFTFKFKDFSRTFPG